MDKELTAHSRHGHTGHMTTTQNLPADSLTADSLRESLAAGRDSFRVGPMRKQGPYHGRVLTGFFNADIARHAAHILRECDGFDVTIVDDATIAVIARKP